MVEIEIGARAAGGVPDGVDRPVEQLQPQGRIAAGRAGRARAAPTSATDRLLDPGANRHLDPLANLELRRTGRFHCLDGAEVGPLRQPGQDSDRSAREQPRGLAVRGADSAAAARTATLLQPPTTAVTTGAGGVNPNLRLRPVAVEVTMELNDWGKIVRVLEVPT